VHISLSELEATLTKAAKGVGLPYGLGQDAARAAGHAKLQGLDCLAAFLDALDALESGRSKAAAVGDLNDGILQPPAGAILSSLWASPSACDLLQAGTAQGQGSAQIHLTKVDVPLVVLAQALSLKATTGANVRIAWNGEDVPAAARDLPRGPLDIRLTLQQSGQVTVLHKSSAPPRGLRVDERLWRRLERYADRNLVENSEESRLSGAGAGVVDRD